MNPISSKISVFAKFIASLCVIFFTSLTASAQVTIGTVDEPTRINICGDGIDKNGNSSEVSITASGSGNFNVQLPVGFHYIVGSVTGATQSNVSNDNNPIFTFVSSPVKIKISADCNFTASRVISVTGGNTALSDNIPNVDAPNVFQSSWTNDVLNNAVVGNTYTRTITITNGDIGYAKSFEFQSKNSAGIQVISTQITSPIVQTLAPVASGDTLKYTISGAVFPAGVNGTSYFEDGEAITITQTIKVLNCTNLSTGNKYRTVFGCFGTPACQESLHTVAVNLGNGVPALTFTGISSIEPTFCTPGTKTYRITNTGTETTPGAGFAKLSTIFAGFAFGYANMQPTNASNQWSFLNLKIGNNNYPSPPLGVSGEISQTTSVITADPDGAGGLEDLDGDNIFSELKVGSFVDVTYTYTLKPRAPNCAENLNYNIPRLYSSFSNQCGTPSADPFNQVQAGPEHILSRVSAPVASGPTDMVANQTSSFCFETSFGNGGWASPILGRYVIKVPSGLNLDGIVSFNGGTAGVTAVQVADSIIVTGPSVGLGKICVPLKLTCPSASNTLAIDFRSYAIEDAGCSPMLLDCKTYTTTGHCPTPCAGAVIPLSFSAERTTFGWTSFDRTTKVTAATPGIDISTAVAYDSVRTVSTGVVVNNLANVVYKADVQLPTPQANWLSLQNNALFRHVNKVSGIAYYSNAGAPAFTSAGGIDKNEYTFMPSAGSPTPVVGDTIQLITKFLVSLNAPGVITQISSFRSGQNSTDPINGRIECDNWGAILKVANPSLYTGTFGYGNLPLVCGSTQAILIGQNTNGDQQDYFPNEFRNQARIDSITETFPSGLVLDSLQYFFAPGDSYGAYSAAPQLPTITGPNTYKIIPNNSWRLKDRISSTYCCIATQIDQWVKPTCAIGDGLQYTFGSVWSTNYDYVDWLTVPTNLSKVVNTFDHSFSFNKPVLTVSSASINATINTLTFDFSISNASAFSGKNVWLGFKNKSGNVNSYISLQNLTDGVNVPLTTYGTVDSAFTATGYKANQSGNNDFANGATKNFRLTVSASSCNRDSIEVFTGWDCAAIPTSPTTYPCPLSKNYLFINVANTGISLQANSPATPQTLCDPIPVSAVLRTTDLGHAYQDSISAVLPSGLSYVSGSAEYRFPAGTGAWMSFTPTGSTTLSFSLGAVIGANGIYGQGDKTGTNDQVEVRFNLRASCSYTSGSRIAFRGFALSPCGATIRTASQYSGKIDIGGLPSTLPNYNLSQSLESAGDCEFKPVRNMTLKLRNIAANPSSATTEGIIVVLPPGASFNSMSNGTCNGTTSQTISSAPTQVTAASGDTLKWTMPAGVVQFDSICIYYKINLKDNCDAKDVQAFSKFNTTITCTGGAYGPVNCSNFSVNTGNDIKAFATPNRPFIAINNVTINSGTVAVGNTINVDVTLVNTNPTAAAPANSLLVEFFCGNNTTPFSTLPFPNAVAASSGSTASMNVSIPASPTCTPGQTLRAVIRRSATSCTCDSSSYLLTTPLPLTLINFTAKKSGKVVFLNWQTSQEININKFKIMRSIDGNIFRQIGTDVIAVGNSTTATNYYTSQDDISTILNPNLYYRLQIIENDGRFKNSNIIKLNNQAQTESFTVYPNPFKENFTVAINAEKAGIVKSVLLDAVGKTIFTKFESVLKGYNVINFAAANYSKGVYLLQIFSENGEPIYTNKVLKY